MALSTLTVAAGVVGSLLAPMTLRPAQFVSLLLVGAFVGAFAAALARSVSEGRGLDTREAALDAGRAAAVGAVWAVGLGVLFLSLGDYGWVAAVGLVAAYPLLRGVLRPALRSGQHPAEDTAGESTGSAGLSRPPFENCSTSELAAAWGASYDLLQVTSSPSMKARIVALRAAYLDELQRRDHLTVKRWLARGYDQASDAGRWFWRPEDGGEARPGLP